MFWSKIEIVVFQTSLVKRAYDVEVTGGYSMALTPDDATVYVACSDGAVKALDLRTSGKAAIVARHEDGCTAVDVVHNGWQIWSAALDGAVCSWDARNPSVALKERSYDSRVQHSFMSLNS